MHTRSSLFAAVVAVAGLCLGASQAIAQPAVTSIADVAALRALPAAYGTTTPAIQLQSYQGLSTAGGGPLNWNASSTAADDGCLVFKPTAVGAGAGRWIRPTLRFGLPLDVDAAQCGVEADQLTDDTDAWKRALALFTDGRTGGTPGHIRFCGASLFSKPLIYSGDQLIWEGCQGETRSSGRTSLQWNGTGYQNALFFAGANESFFRNVNVNCHAPGITVSNGLISCVHFMSDLVNTTLAASSSPGTFVTLTLNTTVGGLTPGSALRVGDAGPNMEIAYVTAVSGLNVTVDRLDNSHTSGEMIGAGGGSSGNGIDFMSITLPTGANTTFTSGITHGTGVTVTPASMTGIAVGRPLYIGGNASIVWEIVYPTAVTGSTFTANFSYDHAAGEDIVLATSGIRIGNVTASGTPQVSENRLTNINCGSDQGATAAYTCIRFVSTGNTKNHKLDTLSLSFPRIGVAFEGSSGVVSINNVAGNATIADFWLGGTAAFHLSSIETEDTNARFIRGGLSATSDGTLTIENSSWQGSAPSDDYIIQTASNVVLINNQFFNWRTESSVPKMQFAGSFTSGGSANSLAITSLGNFYQHTRSLDALFYDGSNNAYNWSQYPINNGLLPNLTSIGDFGNYGSLQYMAGQMSLMSGGPTIDGMASGQTKGNIGQLGETMSYVTVPYTAFQTGSATKNLKSFGIPPNMQVTRIIAKVTTPFTGTSSTVNLRVGTSSAAQDLLVDFDAKSAAVTKGLADADLGSCIKAANAVQGGCFPAGLAASDMWLGMTSGGDNLSNLTAGSVTISLGLRRIAP